MVGLRQPGFESDYSRYVIFPVSFCFSSVSTFTADFEQPRDLWDRVFDEARKEDFVNRVSEHLGGVKNQDILQRQCEVPFLCLSPR